MFYYSNSYINFCPFNTINGIGTVIDYAKENKEVQKLPNNAVKALNIWLENVNKEKKDSINNK